MITTAPVTNSFSQGATITGRLHGGNQPVTGATVRLYAAGTTGYGSVGTLFATTTTSNDAFGSFNFTKLPANTGTLTPTTPIYGCPISGDPQMYIVATGGATQGTGNGVNTAAAFIVALGKCSTVTAATFVDLNEVTTVATMAALQQYFSPVTESFGYPNTTQAAVGFANGVATIANMANVATGTVNTGSSVTATPAGATAPVQVDITPEFAKINTIANITAACVNNPTAASSGCTTLFANAIPPLNTVTSQPTIVYPTTTDVLQATYYMLVNPTSGGATAINTLFALAPPASPFQPTLATAPTDWTIGIRYGSASNCSYGTFLGVAYDLVSDANGNIWVAGGGLSTVTSNLMEVTPTGVPATCALGASVALAKGLIIDINGNVWISGNAKAAPFYKYNIATGTYTTWATPAASTPVTVAADAAGNIFFTDSTSKLWEFVGGANSATPTTAVQVGAIGANPAYIAIDTFGRIFTAQANTAGLYYDTYPSTGSGSLNGYATSQIGTAAQITNPYALMAGINSTIWGANNQNTAAPTLQLTEYFFTPDPNNPGVVTFTPNSPQLAAGINAARGPGAVDGAGNAWYAGSAVSNGNYVTGATTGQSYSIGEFAADLTPLSPSSTSTTANNAGFQKDPTTIVTTSPRGVAIDPTGNVWIGSNTIAGTGIVEIVGAAVPVVTPIASALLAGLNTGNAVRKP